MSPRLEKIFSLLLPQIPVWDLCCDHGLLGRKAYHSGLFTEVHFVDQVEHIMKNLKKDFRYKENHPTQVQFWTSPAEEMQIPMTGNIAIAGVGGHTIVKILESLKQKNLLQAQQILLCPHDHIDKMQKALEESLSDYELKEKHLVLEREKPREVLVYLKNESSMTFPESIPEKS